MSSRIPTVVVAGRVAQMPPGQTVAIEALPVAADGEASAAKLVRSDDARLNAAASWQLAGLLEMDLF